MEGNCEQDAAKVLATFSAKRGWPGECQSWLPAAPEKMRMTAFVLH